MRLTKEDLIEIGNMADQDVSIKKIALKFNYNEANMYRIIKRYKLHGIEGLLHKADSNKFSVEFKIDVINRYYSGESENSLATEINVNVGIIVSWIKKYEQLGYNGLVDNRGRPGNSYYFKKKQKRFNLIIHSIKLYFNI